MPCASDVRGDDLGLNRKGFVTLLDACVFVTIIITAMPLMFMSDVNESDTSDQAGTLMEVIVSARLCLDMVVDIDDRSVTDFTDILAYSVSKDDPRPLDYVEDMIRLYCPGHGFRLYCEYDGKESSRGDGSGEWTSSAECSIPVSVGGYIHIRLTVF